MVKEEEMASSPQVQFQESGIYSSDHCERLVCTEFFFRPLFLPDSPKPGFYRTVILLFSTTFMEYLLFFRQCRHVEKNSFLQIFKVLSLSR